MDIILTIIKSMSPQQIDIQLSAEELQPFAPGDSIQVLVFADGETAKTYITLIP